MFALLCGLVACNEVGNETGDAAAECVRREGDASSYIVFDTFVPDATPVGNRYDGLLEVVSSDASRLVMTRDGTALAFTSNGALPVITPGRSVWVQFHGDITLTSQRWFVAIQQAQHGPLIFAHHARDLALVDAGYFEDGSVLGARLGVRETCTAFDPSYECTSDGGTYTLLDVELGDAIVSPPEERDVVIGGRPYALSVRAAARVAVVGGSICADYMPGDHLHFALIARQ